MRIPHFIIIGVTALGVVFAVGCSKNSAPSNLPETKLGDMELVTQTPKRVPLGDGKDLVVTPTVLPDGSIQMDLDVEPKPADGAIPPFKHARFTARSGQPCGVSLGDRWVSFTPKLKPQ